MAKRTWAEDDGTLDDETPKPRAKPDPELSAMRRILAILEELPVSARRRVAAFVISRAEEISSDLNITGLE